MAIVEVKSWGMRVETKELLCTVNTHAIYSENNPKFAIGGKCKKISFEENKVIIY